MRDMYDARAAGGRGLSRRRDRRPRPQQFRAPGHAERKRRTRADRGDHRGDRETFRRAPARLARALDLAVAGHARSAAGGRLHLSARLVPRRSADLDEDAQGPHPVGALPAGAQRHSADRRAQARGRRLRRHDRRCLRRAARRMRQAPAGDGHRAARLHRRPAAPLQASGARAQSHRSQGRRARLVHHRGRHRRACGQRCRQARCRDRLRSVPGRRTNHADISQSTQHHVSRRGRQLSIV